jgi:hypothetical protein
MQDGLSGRMEESPEPGKLSKIRQPMRDKGAFAGVARPSRTATRAAHEPDFRPEDQEGVLWDELRERNAGRKLPDGK